MNCNIGNIRQGNHARLCNEAPDVDQMNELKCRIHVGFTTFFSPEARHAAGKYFLRQFAEAMPVSYGSIDSLAYQP